MAANKVRFGLKNLHYAIVTETTTLGVTTTSYGTPVAWPGAVKLDKNEADGDDTVFRADDSDYYIVSGSSQGFGGALEVALIPESVWTDVFGATKDDNGVIAEYSSDTVKYIALMFEYQGDNSGRRRMIPKVLLKKPAESFETTGEDGNTPQTTTINFTASPRPDDGLATVKTGDTTPQAVYDDWFTTVYVPTISNGEG